MSESESEMLKIEAHCGSIRNFDIIGTTKILLRQKLVVQNLSYLIGKMKRYGWQGGMHIIVLMRLNDECLSSQARAMAVTAFS